MWFGKEFSQPVTVTFVVKFQSMIFDFEAGAFSATMFLEGYSPMPMMTWFDVCAITPVSS